MKIKSINTHKIHRTVPGTEHVLRGGHQIPHYVLAVCVAGVSQEQRAAHNPLSDLPHLLFLCVDTIISKAT